MRNVPRIYWCTYICLVECAAVKVGWVNSYYVATLLMMASSPKKSKRPTQRTTRKKILCVTSTQVSPPKRENLQNTHTHSYKINVVVMRTATRSRRHTHAPTHRQRQKTRGQAESAQNNRRFDASSTCFMSGCYYCCCPNATRFRDFCGSNRTKLDVLDLNSTAQRIIHTFASVVNYSTNTCTQ